VEQSARPIQFNLARHGEEALERTIRSLPPGRSLAINGSGVILRARPGSARLFTLSVPTTTPADTSRIKQSPLKSAKEATAKALEVHKEIMEGHEDQ
jgi:hypothetical protein